MHHGQRFEWDRDGKLITIKIFNHNELVEYESEGLEARPEYAEAQRLLATGPDDRANSSEARGSVKSDERRDASPPPSGAPVSPQPADDGKAQKGTTDDASQVLLDDVESDPKDEPVKVKPRALAVHGLVIDATTKRAIPRFRVIPAPPGDPEVIWALHFITTHRGGRFDLPPNPRAWPETRFRVEAEGYRPSISRVVKESEGDVKLTFVMQADPGLSGVVHTPEGTPAAGRGPSGQRIPGTRPSAERQSPSRPTPSASEPRSSPPTPRAGSGCRPSATRARSSLRTIAGMPRSGRLISSPRVSSSSADGAESKAGCSRARNPSPVR